MHWKKAKLAENGKCRFDWKKLNRGSQFDWDWWLKIELILEKYNLIEPDEVLEVICWVVVPPLSAIEIGDGGGAFLSAGFNKFPCCC